MLAAVRTGKGTLFAVLDSADGSPAHLLRLPLKVAQVVLRASGHLLLRADLALLVLGFELASLAPFVVLVGESRNRQHLVAFLVLGKVGFARPDLALGLLANLRIVHLYWVGTPTPRFSLLRSGILR